MLAYIGLAHWHIVTTQEHSMIHTIYQAGPYFTDAEIQWHQDLTAKLETLGHIVLWPGDFLYPILIEEAGEHAPRFIFDSCCAAIDESSILVAILDGTQVDDGTSWEIGYAYGKGIPAYGLRTDNRVAGDTRHSHMNSMIEGCLSGLAGTMDELLSMIAKATASPA